MVKFENPYPYYNAVHSTNDVFLENYDLERSGNGKMAQINDQLYENIPVTENADKLRRRNILS